MTDIDAMTEDDWRKFAEIVSAGGKIHVASSSFPRLREMAIKAKAWLLLDAMVPNDLIEPGTFVAHKADPDYIEIPRFLRRGDD